MNPLRTPERLIGAMIGAATILSIVSLRSAADGSYLVATSGAVLACMMIFTAWDTASRRRNG